MRNEQERDLAIGTFDLGVASTELRLDYENIMIVYFSIKNAYENHTTVLEGLLRRVLLKF